MYKYCSPLAVVSGPPADRCLLVRAVECCDMLAVADAPAGVDSYLLLKYCGEEFRTATVAKSQEPRYDQVFAFPLHSESTERGDSEVLRVELWSKNRLRGDNFLGATTFDMGRLCSSPSRGCGLRSQPIRACKEMDHAHWCANENQLPGELRCAGQVRVPAVEWAESSRDFTRAFAATANGSGDMLLLGQTEIAKHGTMQPVRSSMQNSGNVNDDVTAAAVQEFRVTVESSMLAANLDTCDLDDVCRRLIDSLTVSPAMQVLVENDVSPAMYQNRFIIMIGSDSIRVATYGFIGPGAVGDRPDRKHTGIVLRLLTDNLLAPREVATEGSNGDDGSVIVSYSCKLTTEELIDAVIAIDQPVLVQAVTTGDFSHFAQLPALPQTWVSDSWWRLENDQAYGTPSTGLLRVCVGIFVPELAEELTASARELVAEHGETARKDIAKLLNDDSCETAQDTSSPLDKEGYPVPGFLSEQEWSLYEARIVRTQELNLTRWFEYLSRCPRICPLPIGTDYIDGKEVSKAHVAADLRDLIVAGIPPQWACEAHEKMQFSLMEMGAEHLGTLRSKLWLELTGAKDLKLGSKVSYADMSKCTTEGAPMEHWLSLGQHISSFTVMNKERKQVCKDVPRTGDMSPAETEALERVLLTFTLKYPSIGYCQSMNFVALALLRAMRSEENAFWVLSGICTNVLHGYYTQSMSRTQIDTKILSQLVEVKLPAIHLHLTELDCPLELMVSQWLLPIFVTSFPAGTAFVIW